MEQIPLGKSEGIDLTPMKTQRHPPKKPNICNENQEKGGLVSIHTDAFPRKNQ